MPVFQEASDITTAIQEVSDFIDFDEDITVLEYEFEEDDEDEVIVEEDDIIDIELNESFQL